MTILKVILISLFVSAFSAQAMECTIETSYLCPSDHHCVNVAVNEPGVCWPNYLGELPVLMFPFVDSSNLEIRCWKSAGLVTDSSHSWNNSRYAIDLFSRQFEEGLIRAGRAGEVAAHGGCQPDEPRCNSGFGNQVKIFTNDGFMLYYVHLSKILVRTGQRVEAGQVIGVEGRTGAVGGMYGEDNDFKHLHMSVHQIYPNDQNDFRMETYPWFDSIPYKLAMCDPTVINRCEPKDVDIRDVPCLKFNPKAPLLKSYF